MTPEVRGYRGAIPDHAGFVARVRGRPFQVLRADRVYGPEHLAHAASLAARAVAEGRARSADLATETLLYAAGERQVHKALARLGVDADARAFAAIVWDARAMDGFAAEMGWTRDDAALAGDERALDALDVSAAERAMLPRERWGDLILEKVALLDVAKP